MKDMHFSASEPDTARLTTVRRNLGTGRSAGVDLPRSSFAEESCDTGEECTEDPAYDLEAAEGVGNPHIPATGAVGGPLGGLPRGEGAGERVIERVQGWVQAARSVLQFSTRSGAGDLCRLADGWGGFPGRLVGGRWA
jgi:hypothetical protein